MGKIHILKTWPEQWDAIDRGDKTFEARRDDRGFSVGDALVLRRFCPGEGVTMMGGAPVDQTVWVTHILRGGQFGIEPGHVVMSVRKHEATREP